MTAFDNSDITLANGTLTAVSSGDGGVTWTGTFTPTDDVEDASNVISVATTLTDLAGNAPLAGANTSNYTIDTTEPVISSVVMSDSALKVGETSTLTITFSEAVTAFDNSDITLANGTLTAVSSSDSGVTWMGTFTPTDNLEDATNVISVGTAFTDTVGNAPLSGASTSNYTIDTTEPVISSVVMSDSELTVGETSTLTITFSEAVTAFDNSDITLANGTLSAVSSGDGGVTWTGTFTPTDDLEDATNVISVATTLTDSAGNAPLAGASTSNYTIDTMEPTVAITRDDANPTNTNTVVFSVDFSQDVTGVDMADFTLALSGVTANATVTVDNAGDADASTYTVTVDTIAGDGTLGLDIAGGGIIIDNVGNTVNTTPTTDEVYTIDNTAPTVVITRDSANPTNANTVVFSVDFSQDVTGVDAGDFALALSGVTANATVTVGNAGDSDDSTYTVTVDTIAGDGTLGLDMDGGTDIADLATNALNTTPTTDEVYTIDNVVPTVAITRDDANPTNAVSVSFSVDFNEDVTGVDASDFTLALSGVQANSVVVVGNAGDADASTYTVTVNGIAGNGTLGLDIAGGHNITDLATNALNTTPTADEDYTAIDNTPPTAAITCDDTSPTNANSVVFSVDFSEDVTNVDAADFTLALSGVTANATVTVGDAGDADDSTYTVTVDTIAGNGTLGLDIAGGTNIIDVATNAVNTTPTTDEVYTIDTTVPTVAITRDDANPTNATSVVFSVDFSEDITEIDAADFVLDLTGLTANATVTVGDAGDADASTYTVTVDTIAGDGTLGLDIAAGNNITDLSTNAVNTTATTDESYTVDNVVPTVAITRDDANPTNANSVILSVDFSEDVTNVDAADFVLDLTDLTANATVTVGNAGDADASTYTVTVDTIAGDGTLGLDMAGGNDITDALANAVNTTPTSDEIYTIDTVVPTVAITRDDANPTNATSVVFSVDFSEDVTNVDAADFTLALSGVTANATVAVGNAGDADASTYTVTVDTVSGNGTLGLDIVGGTDITDPTANVVNTTPTTDEEYTIDTAVPTVAITRDDANPTNATSVIFSVDFSEDVTGVDAADFTLALSGVTANGTVTVGNAGDADASTYTVTVDTIAGDGTLGLDIAGSNNITDVATNAVNTTPTTDEPYTIDNTVPTVSITRDDANPTNANTVVFSVDFSQDVTDVDATDFTLALSGVTANASVTVGNAGDGDDSTYTVTVDTIAGDGTLGLDIAGGSNITDVATNALNTTPTTDDTYTIDNTVSTVTITRDNANLTNANTVVFSVDFSQDVTNVDATDFTLALSGVTANATVTVGNADDADDSTYAVTVNTVAGDGTLGLDISGGHNIVDIASNAINATPTVDEVYTIDNTVPAVSSVVMSDSALKVGDTSTLTMTFSEAVTGFDNTDITLANGTLTAVSSGDGGVTWTGTFTPTDDMEEATNVISVATTFTDTAGNAPLAGNSSSNYTIDTTEPVISSVTMSDSALKADETSILTITFSEAVTAFDNSDITVANGTLTSVSSSDSGVTWTGTFTPSDNLEDATNVISVAATLTDLTGNAPLAGASTNNYSINTCRPVISGVVLSDSALKVGETSTLTVTFSEAVTAFDNSDITLANGTLTTISSADGGVTWTGTFTPTDDIEDTSNAISVATTLTDLAGNAPLAGASTSNYTIDTTEPLISSMVMSDSALKVGETSTLTMTFSEAVTGFDNTDITLANGTLTAVSSGDGGVTWTGTFTPTDDIEDTTNVISVAVTLTDLAGNALLSGASTSNYSIDTTEPVVSSVVMSDTALKVGETSTLTITFSEGVTAFDNSDITLANGTLTPVSSGDGGVTWTGTFTPTDDLEDTTNVISVAATLTDLTGNAPLAGNSTSNYTIDTTEPVVSSVVMSDTALKVGDTSCLTISFSEAVIAFDNSDITLAGGTLTAIGTVDSGVTWTGTFTPTDDLEDTTNVISVATTLTDLAGNAPLAGASTSNYTIDTVEPRVAITRDDANLTNADTVIFSVDFSEGVTGVDAADFVLDLTGVTANATVTVGNAGDADPSTYKVTIDTIAGDGALGLDIAGSHNITDLVTNTLNTTPTTDEVYTIDNTPPVITAAQSLNVSEDAADTTSAGTVAAIDAGTLQAWTITAGNGDGVFAINAGTGEITVVDNANLNHETIDTYVLTLTVGDEVHTSDSETITIHVTDVNEADPVANDQNFAIVENLANGTSVGMVAASDADTSQTLTYAITAGNTNTAFTINSSTGDITVNDMGELDYETKASYDLTVQVTDSQSPTRSDTATVTINVTDVNDNAPVITSGQSFNVAEHAVNTTSVGTVLATDVDTTGSLETWTITAGNDDAIFAINNASGEITVADNTNLDYEAADTYVLTLTVGDGVNTSATMSVTINVTDVNDDVSVMTASRSIIVIEAAADTTSVDIHLGSLFHEPSDVGSGNRPIPHLVRGVALDRQPSSGATKIPTSLASVLYSLSRTPLTPAANVCFFPLIGKGGRLPTRNRHFQATDRRSATAQLPGTQWTLGARPGSLLQAMGTASLRPQSRAIPRPRLLGKRYDTGRSVKRTALARTYEQNQALEKYYTKAQEWYGKTAEKGLATAQLRVSEMYRAGRKVEQDYLAHIDEKGQALREYYARTKAWYTKAAKTGLAAAQSRFSELYKTGESVEQDSEKGTDSYTEVKE